MITLVFEMFWLLLLTFDKISGFGANLLNNVDTPSADGAEAKDIVSKHSWSYFSIVIVGSLNIMVGLYSFRHEIRTKYTAVFQQLLDYQPPSGIYHKIYKQ